MKTIDASIKETITSDIHAIVTLCANNLHLHALSTMYSSIDKMAWLTVSRNENNGDDFTSWVNDHLIRGRNLEFNAKDLWAARCGILHTGAAESRDYRKNDANLIYYTCGKTTDKQQTIEHIRDYLTTEGIPPERVSLIDYHWLINEYIDALKIFEENLKLDQKTHELAAMKAKKQLKFKITENENP